MTSRDHILTTLDQASVIL